jgi:hypothetical protein
MPWKLWLYPRDRVGSDGPYFFATWRELMASLGAQRPDNIRRFEIEGPLLVKGTAI